MCKLVYCREQKERERQQKIEQEREEKRRRQQEEERRLKEEEDKRRKAEKEKAEREKAARKVLYSPVSLRSTSQGKRKNNLIRILLLLWLRVNLEIFRLRGFYAIHQFLYSSLTVVYSCWLFLPMELANNVEKLFTSQNNIRSCLRGMILPQLMSMQFPKSG